MYSMYVYLFIKNVLVRMNNCKKKIVINDIVYRKKRKELP